MNEGQVASLINHISDNIDAFRQLTCVKSLKQYCFSALGLTDGNASNSIAASDILLLSAKSNVTTISISSDFCPTDDSLISIPLLRDMTDFTSAAPTAEYAHQCDRSDMSLSSSDGPDQGSSAINLQHLHALYKLLLPSITRMLYGETLRKVIRTLLTLPIADLEAFQRDKHKYGQWIITAAKTDSSLASLSDVGTHLWVYR
jgi:hypothetical protein